MNLRKGDKGDQGKRMDGNFCPVIQRPLDTVKEVCVVIDWRRSDRYWVWLVVGTVRRGKDGPAMMCLRLHDSRIKSCELECLGFFLKGSPKGINITKS